LKIEVVIAEVTTSVGGLNDHGLSLDGTSGESKARQVGKYDEFLMS
jgi:hypothetical protein